MKPFSQQDRDAPRPPDPRDGADRLDGGRGDLEDESYATDETIGEGETIQPVGGPEGRPLL